jgi:internalin A
LRKLTRLEKLFLHRNPALGLPPEVLGAAPNEILDEGDEFALPASILDYYFSKRVSRPLNEAKMILVGRGGVGKTSLVNLLVHGRYNPKETKTDGIAITQWPVKIGQDQVQLNIWDFGGQEIMHATHQFFLTKRSLYLLVLNAREGEQDGNVEYWLRLIQSFGGDSPVLIVINKAQSHAFDLNRRGLKEKFPAIRDFLQTDCESEQGLEELRRVVLRETDQLEHLRDPFPASWFSVKDTLAHLREREGENFIPFTRYQQLCAEQGVKEAVSQETLVGFLHDLGIVVNFRDDLRLADTHVLNPEWVTNGIYKVLNDPQIAEQQGELRLEDLARVLDQQEYPRKMHLYLLDLMRKFELCYEFYDGEASSEPCRSRREEAQTSMKTEPPHVGSYRLGGGDGHYLVPELLGKEEPDLREFAGAEALRFSYRYNILPEGLLPRFIVRSRALMKKDQQRWRTGVVLEWEGNRGVVKADLQDRTVSIAVVGDGTGRRRLLTVIRADLEVIHRSITKLEATEEVPVPGQAGLAVGYATLCVLEAEGETELKLVHNGKLVKVTIADLLNGVEEASTRPSELMRKTGAREGVRVAFSYSHKDEELRDQLETHLKYLQRQGFISTWHDRKIMPGDKWAGVIDDNFKRADLILLLVSADFIASDYCYEIEMQTALEREKEGEAAVVPVILRECKWKKSPFAELEALPRDGEPVTNWTNRDKAWTNVADGIEKVVAELRQRGK